MFIVWHLPNSQTLTIFADLLSEMPLLGAVIKQGLKLSSDQTSISQS
jgi:hypothetical protein